jgi:hypothetical protein
MTDDLLISSLAIRKYLIGRAFIGMMTRTQSTMLPLLALSAMSSTNFTSIIKYTVNGSVYDEHGTPVGEADVLVKSSAELKETITSREGSFTAEILVSGILDTILVSATSGDRQGSSTIPAEGSQAIVEVVLKDAKGMNARL